MKNSLFKKGFLKQKDHVYPEGPCSPEESSFPERPSSLERTLFSKRRMNDKYVFAKFHNEISLKSGDLGVPEN